MDLFLFTGRQKSAIACALFCFLSVIGISAQGEAVLDRIESGALDEATVEELEQALFELEMLLSDEVDGLDVFLNETRPGALSGYAFFELGAGFDDNVLLELGGSESAFTHFMFDGDLAWAPFEHSSFEALGFFDGRLFADSEYFEELFATAEVAWAHDWGSFLGTRLALSFIHSQHAFDVTESAVFPLIGVVRENRPKVELEFNRRWGTNGTMRAGFSGSQIRFGGSSNDYDLYGGFLQWETLVSDRSRLSAQVSFYREDYLDTYTRTPSGLTMFLVPLQIDEFQARLSWRRQFREGWVKSMTIPLSANWEEDLNGGYFDRFRVSLRPNLRMQFGKWTLDTFLGLVYVHYPSRWVSFIDQSNQWQFRWNTTTRISRNWGNWNVWLEGTWEDLDSNLETVAYRRRMVELGIGRYF
jgi:hypothetical protein